MLVLQCLEIRLVSKVYEILTCRVFTHCDGGHRTSGPDSLQGSLGQALMTAATL